MVSKFDELTQRIVNSSDEQEKIKNIQRLSALLLETDKVPFLELIDSKIIPEIIDLLQSDENPKLQRESACILSTFASLDFNGADSLKLTFCDLFIKHNAVQHLMSLIRPPTMPELGEFCTPSWVQGQAIDALGNIAALSCMMRDMILSENLLDILHDICQDSVHDTTKKSLLFHASYTLSMLCQKQPLPEQRHVVMEMKIIEQLLANNGDQEQVLLNACWSFAYLARSVFASDLSKHSEGISEEVDDPRTVSGSDSIDPVNHRRSVYKIRKSVSSLKTRVSKLGAKAKSKVFACFVSRQRDFDELRANSALEAEGSLNDDSSVEELYFERQACSTQYEQIAALLDDDELEFDENSDSDQRDQSADAALKYTILKRIVQCIKSDNNELKQPIYKVISGILSPHKSDINVDAEAIQILLSEIEQILAEYMNHGNDRNAKNVVKVCEIIRKYLVRHTQMIDSMIQSHVVSRVIGVLSIHGQNVQHAINICDPLLSIIADIVKYGNFKQVRFVVNGGIIRILMKYLDKANGQDNVFRIGVIVKSIENMLEMCEQPHTSNLCAKSLMKHNALHHLENVVQNAKISGDLRRRISEHIMEHPDVKNETEQQLQEIMGMNSPLGKDDVQKQDLIKL